MRLNKIQEYVSIRKKTAVAAWIFPIGAFPIMCGSFPMGKARKAMCAMAEGRKISWAIMRKIFLRL